MRSAYLSLTLTPNHLPPFCLQDFDLLKLPAPNPNANDTVVCTTEYGRQYYLTIQFVVLAFLVGSQAVGSIIFIVMYYWRRITWRFRNRKGKKRIAKAAHDALALKNKGAGGYEPGYAPSVGTSITEKLGTDALWYGDGARSQMGSEYLDDEEYIVGPDGEDDERAYLDDDQDSLPYSVHTSSPSASR